MLFSLDWLTEPSSSRSSSTDVWYKALFLCALREVSIDIPQVWSFVCVAYSCLCPACLFVDSKAWVGKDQSAGHRRLVETRQEQGSKDVPSSCSITQRQFCHCLFFSVIIKKKKWWSLSSPLQSFLSSCGIIGPCSRFEINFLYQRGKDQEDPENNRQTDEDSERRGKAEDMWTYRLADCRWQKRADKEWGGKAEMAADDPLAWHAILRVQAPATSPS